MVTERRPLTTLICYSVAVLTRGSLIVADAIVVAVTWTRMHGQVREVFALKMTLTASTVMLADGESIIVAISRVTTNLYVLREPILHVSSAF